MGFSAEEMDDLSKRIGRTPVTLYKWAREGCDLRNHDSVQQWIEKKKHREPEMVRQYRARKAKEAGESEQVTEGVLSKTSFENGEALAPAGQKGAQHALARLESQEEEAHRRLQAALERGNAYQIEKAQEFWLRCSETLRRLDLAVEVARRQEETQIPLKVAEDAVLASAEWMRIAITSFLSSESVALTAFSDPREFKSYFFARFPGFVELVVKSADKTASAVPDWAKTRIKEAWNVRD